MAGIWSRYVPTASERQAGSRAQTDCSVPTGWCCAEATSPRSSTSQGEFIHFGTTLLTDLSVPRFIGLNISLLMRHVVYFRCVCFISALSGSVSLFLWPFGEVHNLVYPLYQNKCSFNTQPLQEQHGGIILPPTLSCFVVCLLLLLQYLI